MKIQHPVYDRNGEIIKPGVWVVVLANPDFADDAGKIAYVHRLTRNIYRGEVAARVQDTTADILTSKDWTWSAWIPCKYLLVTAAPQTQPNLEESTTTR